MDFLCPECKIKSYNTLASLSLHYRKTHKKPSKDLYKTLYNNGIEQVCKCGCGEITKFIGILYGFRDYRRGHAARINNNYQTCKSKNNSIATRRNMIAKGVYKPFAAIETGQVWNAGLTKKTDLRVAKISEAINQPEEIKIRSERMKNNRLTGVVKTLRGKDHSQWKGGISDLNGVSRNNPKLYSGWIYPKLCASGFKCAECGLSNGKLEVHHNKEKFSEIAKLHIEKFNWKNEIKICGYDTMSEDLLEIKRKISDAVADYHIKNNISGVVLCKLCHKKEHKSYNF